MPRIEIETMISAPMERVFDLARSVDAHMCSTAPTGERAIAGITSGLLGLGDQVTWRARHFGIWQDLTSRVTAYQRPQYFRDSMAEGIFRRFDHDHHFESVGSDGTDTRMTDSFDLTSPLGLLGVVADRLFLTRYLRTLLLRRNETLKRLAETEGWKMFLSQP
jgi:ligand-binding SRPBCC domain-containing protein